MCNRLTELTLRIDKSMQYIFPKKKIPRRMETTSQKKFAIPLHMLFVHLFAFIYVDTIPISFHSLCFHHLNGFFYNQQPNCIFFFFFLILQLARHKQILFRIPFYYCILLSSCIAWPGFFLSLSFSITGVCIFSCKTRLLLWDH